MTIRDRFAPSPTGFLHVGGLRTALYNFLFARQQGGSFLLRIEDTDRTRYVEGSIQNLIESLRWAGVDFDEGPGKEGACGPYLQSERLALYKRYALDLIDKGLAYYAFDSAEELDLMRKAQAKRGSPIIRYDRGYMKNSLTRSPEEVEDLLAKKEDVVIRMKVPEDREAYVVRDLLHGDVTFGAESIDDQVLLKADGFPTYHLASVVDDHHMGITHIIRGEEWLPSAPKHILLYEFLGWTPPTMIHLPLLLNPDGSKMSKRKSDSGQQIDVSVEEYKKRGFLPQALINYLALLGWNPGTDREIFTLPELVEAFSLDRLQKAGATFDLDKLVWFNKQHLRLLPLPSLAALVKPLLTEAGLPLPSDETLETIVGLMRERIDFHQEIPTSAAYFFREPQTYDELAVQKNWKPTSGALLSAFAEAIGALAAFDHASLEQALKDTAKAHKEKPAALIHPTRIALSGLGMGPGLYEIMLVLGKETCLQRLRTAVARLA